MSAIHARRQQGATLVIVLILLLMATILGLASMRGTLLDERMSANLYDRSLAFQSTERALRQAEQIVRNASVKIGQDCETDPTISACALPDPLTGDIADADAVWTDATAPGAGDGPVAGTPQYMIQRMHSTDSAQAMQQDRNAASTNEQYLPGQVGTQENYRIFARSQDPALAPDRAVVMLQSNVVRR